MTLLEQGRALIAESVALAARHRRQARYLARGVRGVVLTDERGRSVVAGPDPSKPGIYRWTRIGADGEPTGHTEAASLEAAVLAALEEGYGCDGSSR